MALAITGIINESREYYRKLKREVVGRLLINLRGQLVEKKLGNKRYVYLRRYVANGYKDYYIGPLDAPAVADMPEELSNRKILLDELRKAKQAMKELHMAKSEIVNEDYFPALRMIVSEFDKTGLWDAGIELVGSWCFKAYQNYCGVEYYPERTLDVDFAVSIPYKGKPVDIADSLKALGFREEINHADGSVRFISGEFKVEFLKDRRGDGASRKGKSDYEPDLGITPQVLPYLRILLDNPTEIRARELGRIKVPSMPAFLLHKLLVADVRREDGKRQKDYRQVDAVAKTVLASPDLLGETADIASKLHKKWVKKIIGSAGRIGESLPAHSGAVAAVLRRAGIIE